MGFFNNLGDKLGTFMIGRNGSDRLGRWALGAAVVVLVINVFIPNPILMMISYALLFYSVYRMFSTNTAARARENERFEDFLGRFPFGRHGTTSSNSKTGSTSHQTSSSNTQASTTANNTAKPHRPTTSTDTEKMKISCEQCGQSLSVPRGRGTLKVTCPKCNHQMKVKS